MRILLLAQFFPPDIGGEERHVLNLANTLAARGHEVAVATQRGGSMARRAARRACRHCRPSACQDNVFSCAGRSCRATKLGILRRPTRACLPVLARHRPRDTRPWRRYLGLHCATRESTERHKGRI
jgi:glycosyltransferase involved in cell wall biosynthesis